MAKKTPNKQTENQTYLLALFGPRTVQVVAQPVKQLLAGSAAF